MINHVIWFKKNLRVVDNATFWTQNIKNFNLLLASVMGTKRHVSSTMGIYFRSLKDLRNQHYKSPFKYFKRRCSWVLKTFKVWN